MTKSTLGSFNDDVQPRSGFIYPVVGDQITCLVPYETGAKVSCGEAGIIPARAAGEVIELRMPGSLKENPGYIGCVVWFKALKRVYPFGFVIPWDEVSNPDAFRFSKGQ